MNFIFDKRVIGEKRAALALCIMVALLVFFNPFNKTTESILLSSILILVSAIPFFLWKRKKNRDVVVMGVFFYGFFHLVGYGFSGFIAHEAATLISSGNISDVSDSSENTAKILVIAHLLIVFSGLVILQTFFQNSKPEKGQKRKPKESMISRARISRWGKKLLARSWEVFNCRRPRRRVRTSVPPRRRPFRQPCTRP